MFLILLFIMFNTWLYIEFYIEAFTETSSCDVCVKKNSSEPFKADVGINSFSQCAAICCGCHIQSPPDLAQYRTLWAKPKKILSVFSLCYSIPQYLSLFVTSHSVVRFICDIVS